MTVETFCRENDLNLSEKLFEKFKNENLSESEWKEKLYKNMKTKFDRIYDRVSSWYAQHDPEDEKPKSWKRWELVAFYLRVEREKLNEKYRRYRQECN